MRFILPDTMHHHHHTKNGALKNYSADFLPLKMEAYRIVGFFITDLKHRFLFLRDCFTRHGCHYYKLERKEGNNTQVINCSSLV